MAPLDARRTGLLEVRDLGLGVIGLRGEIGMVAQVSLSLCGSKVCPARKGPSVDNELTVSTRLLDYGPLHRETDRQTAAPHCQ